MLGNYKAYAWMMQKRSDEPEVEMLSSNTLPFSQNNFKLSSPRQAMTTRKALIINVRQAPAYFEGSWTVSCFRPFLRRRLSTSRPQRVAIRSRNP